MNSDAFLLASGAAIQEALKNAESDPRFSKHAYQLLKNRILQVIDGFIGGQKELSALHKTIDQLLGVTAKHRDSPASIGRSRLAAELASKYLNVVLSDEGNTRLVHNSVANFSAAFVRERLGISAHGNDFLRKLALRANAGLLPLSSELPDVKQTLLLKICLVYISAVEAAPDRSLLQRILRNFELVSVFSAQDQLFFSFLQNITAAYEFVLQAPTAQPDKWLLESFDLLSSFYEEVRASAFARGREILARFDEFLDGTAARSELYVPFKILYLLRQQSQSPAALASFPLDSVFGDARSAPSDIVRSVLERLRVAGAIRRWTISAICEALGISRFADQLNPLEGQNQPFRSLSRLSSSDAGVPVNTPGLK